MNQVQRAGGCAGLEPRHLAALFGFAVVTALASTSCVPSTPEAGRGRGLTIIDPTPVPTSAASAQSLAASRKNATRGKEPNYANGDVTPRTGAPGATQGTISCGTSRCRPGKETCTLDENVHWICIARNEHASDEMQFPYDAQCDDASDCGVNERCCVNLAWAQTCMPRTNVEECVTEVCHDDGAACPSGTSCTHRASAGDDARGQFDPKGIQGTCDAPPPVATCGGRLRCPDDRPVCVQGKTGLSCEARGTAIYQSASREHRYLCTLPSDCNGGEACFYSAGGEMPTETATHCGRFVWSYIAGVVCDPGVPVPPMPGRDPASHAVAKCSAPKGGLLPWLGAVH